jgi:hypothetical protein
MKTKATEMHEGLEAFTRFQNAMKAVLAVPHDEIKRRIEAERKASALKPTRPGPKPKRKPSARVPGAS